MIKLPLGRQSKTQKAIRKLLGDYELPSFPGAILHALDLVRKNDVPAEEIAEAIQVDPGLSVGVLKLVNSAGFGLRYAVKDLASAVALVGQSSLEPLLISMGLKEVLPQEPMKGFDPDSFWSTAARRATTARALATIVRPAECSLSFTAGLLQDMAIPMLAARVGNRYGELLECWHNGDATLHDLEQSSFGWDHAQVAKAMCERWELPGELAEAIAEHHAWNEDSAEPPSPVMLAALLREGEEHDGSEALVDTAHEAYGIEADALNELLEKSFEAAEELGNLLA